MLEVLVLTACGLLWGLVTLGAGIIDGRTQQLSPDNNRDNNNNNSNNKQLADTDQ